MQELKFNRGDKVIDKKSPEAGYGKIKVVKDSGEVLCKWHFNSGQVDLYSFNPKDLKLKEEE